MPDAVEAMRRDAARRAQEMHKRAQVPPPGYSGSTFSSAAPPQPAQPPTSAPAPAPPAAKPAPAPSTQKQNGPAPSFFETLFADRERNLLLGLLLLLLEEPDTEPGTLLALFYLLL